MIIINIKYSNYCLHAEKAAEQIPKRGKEMERKARVNIENSRGRLISGCRSLVFFVGKDDC